MAKRSISSTDSESTHAVSSHSEGVLQKRQKTHHQPSSASVILNRVATNFVGFIMSTFKSSEPPRPSSTPTTKVYPDLPKPYSAPSSPPSAAREIRPSASGSTLEEGLSPRNPINLADEEDENSESSRSAAGGEEASSSKTPGWSEYPTNGGSRFAASQQVRPSRRLRPQLSSSDSMKRTYDWVDTATSSTSSSKTDQRKLQANHTRKSKLTSRLKDAAARSVKLTRNTLSIGRKRETEFFSGGETQGREGFLRFQQAISASDKQTLDANIKPEIKPYQPTKARIQAPQHPVRDISDLLDQISLEKAKADKLALDRLQVSLPTRLKDEEEALVTASLRNSHFSKESVKIGSLLRLKPGIWLDDEIINHYGRMIQKRSTDDESGKFPKVFYCNSFFYEKMGKGYSPALGRWTKRVKIFELDVLVMAINIGNQHWTCCAIDMRHKRIEYYDSMGDGGRARDELFPTVMAYLAAEHQAKLGKPFDPAGWVLAFEPGNPHQDNGCDCGIFACQTMENVARGKDLVDDKWEFGQKNMPFFRRMMIYEIATEKLYKRW